MLREGGPLGERPPLQETARAGVLTRKRLQRRPLGEQFQKSPPAEQLLLTFLGLPLSTFSELCWMRRQPLPMKPQ